MLLIYSPNISNRLRYITKVAFTSCIKTGYELTTNVQQFIEYTGPKFSYGKQPINSLPFLYAEGLLDETDLRTAIPAQGAGHKGLPTIFDNSVRALLPYDALAAAFYMAVRVEEYLPHETDQHGRYIPTQSIAYQYGFLNKPIVNLWVLQLAEVLQVVYPDFTWQKPKFEFISTIDVDSAFSYAHKGFLRTVGGLANDVLDFNFKRIPERFKSLGHDANDPFNTYHIIEGIAKQHKHRLQWFFLVADYGYNDKNPTWDSLGYQRLMKRLADKYHAGVHPSYASFLHLEKVGEERDRVAQSIGRHVDSARCHFLRLKFPETYRTQLYFNIAHDYTMAHSPLPGFRSGMCTPYRWYDLLREEDTTLTLHPSAVMEGTLRDYMKLSPQEGSRVIKQLMDEVKHTGGQFISIWHNDSFTPENREWIGVYEEMVSQAVS